MKPTITCKKRDSPYEIILRAKKALSASGKSNSEIAEIGIEASAKRNVTEIKAYLRKYVIILEQV